MKRPRASFLLVSLSPCLLVCCAVGCRQEMAKQPRYSPLQESNFFGDDRSARPLEPGTVARGQAHEDLSSASDAGAPPEARWIAGVVGLAGGGSLNLAPAYASGYVSPVPVTYDLLSRGRERFNIYCAVCHDRVGTGRGKIVERGYLHPPSYHIDRLREAPSIHFYDVITRGYGGMPTYADKIAPADRWAIIAYIRALQLSQDARFADLTPEDQEKLRPKEERK